MAHFCVELEARICYNNINNIRDLRAIYPAGKYGGGFIMKKLFTIDQFLKAIISGIGWGLGVIIPEHLGCSQLVCLLVSFALGMSFDAVAGRIFKIRKIQEKLSRKILVGIAFAAVFAVCELFVRYYTGKSLFDSLKEQLVYVIALPLLGFVISLASSYIKRKQIEKRYGRGESGYVADSAEREYYESLNCQNSPVTGDYDSKYAVKVKNGTFVGFKDGKILTFLGIPYATAGRFEAPEPVAGSDGVFEAKHYGFSPVQPIYEHSPVGWHNQSEDCFTLNVFMRSGSKIQEKKAVIVMPMVSDFCSGSSVSPIMDASAFLEKHDDVIFVTFNFRTGIFGFTDLSVLDGGEKYPHSAELGVLDCIEALKWVKDNISAFGGNGDNITLIGIGLGGMITSILAACDKAKGLFSKVDLISNYAGLISSAESKRADSKALAEYFSCSCADDLLAVPCEALRDYPGRYTGPAYGTETLPGSLKEAYEKGRAADIDILFDQSSGDFGEWILFEGLKDAESYLDPCLEYLNSGTDDEGREYIRSAKEELLSSGMSEGEAKRYLVETLLFRTATLALAEAQISSGGKAWFMYSDVTSDVELFGMNSTYGLCYMLGNKKYSEKLGFLYYAPGAEIAQNMLRNFAVNSDPSILAGDMDNVPAIKWPVFDGTDATVMAAVDTGYVLGKTDLVKDTSQFLKLNNF